MGLEADCTLRIGKKASLGRAYLEGETLSFRGDSHVEVPFDKMGEVRADEGALIVQADGQELRFELGEIVATRWARLIREPKGLFEKLEIGPQSRVAVVDVQDSLFLLALRERTAAVAEGRVPGDSPVIFFGVESRDALRKIQLLRARMVDTGVLWLVRPKGSKAIPEGEVLEALRAAGLADTKVVSFSKTHTAHKCVVPVELRGQPIRVRPPIVSIPPSAPSLAAAAAKRGAAAKKPAAAAAANKKPAAPPKKARTASPKAAAGPKRAAAKKKPKPSARPSAKKRR